MVPHMCSASAVGSVQTTSGQKGQPWSLLICLLGPFRLLSAQQTPLTCGGEQAEALLGYLALSRGKTLPRDQLLAVLWPDVDPLLASQSLNSLVYSVRKGLRDELGGAAPVLQNNGHYQLNCTAGVSVDVVQFEHFVHVGEQYAQAGQMAQAGVAYQQAVALYQGDLCLAPEPQAVIERERLRACYLTLLMRLADEYYQARQYVQCQSYVQQLLCSDPCREDAHRLAMRCYVQVGQRAQSLRQYRLCQTLLRSEFDAAPEPATVALFDQIRQDPTQV